MTLVASYAVSGHPVVVGDVMLSNPLHDRSQKSVPMPTSASASDYMGDRFASRLLQKVNIINDQLVLAWAGSPLWAKAFFEEMAKHGADITFEVIEKTLNAWKLERNIDLYLTGLFVPRLENTITLIIQFAWDSDTGWKSQSSDLGGNTTCYYGGTGGPHFAEAVHLTPSFSHLNVNSAEASIMTTISHLTRLAGDQIRSGVGLEAAFGGAFELATIISGRIEKVKDIGYHFLEARCPDNKEVFFTPYVTLKICYFEDYLVVRKLDYGTPPKTEVYIIKPAHRFMPDEEKKRVSEEFKTPSFNSFFSSFYIYLPEVVPKQNTFVTTHKGKNSPICFDEGEDGVCVDFSGELFTRVKNAINKGEAN